MKDNHFDDILKHKLDAMQTDSAADWNVFAQKLEESIQSDENTFDQLVGQKLNNVQSPKLPDWDAFSEKLHSSDIFDQSISDKLTEIDTSKVSEHWLLLKERLEHILYFKEKLYSIKLFESFLIVALLVTFVNISPVLFPGKPIATQESTIVEDHSNAKQIAAAPLTATASNSEAKQGQTQSIATSSQTLSPVAVHTTTNLVQSPNKQPIQSSAPASKTASSQQAKHNTPPTVDSVDDHSPRQEANTANSQKKKPSIPSTPTLEKLALHGLYPTRHKATLIASTDEKLSVDRQVNIHAIGGISSHFVHIDNPDPSQDNKHAFFTQTVSSQVGLLVSKEHSNFSVESGIIIAKRQYDGLGDLAVNDNLITVPVNLKFYTNQYNRWSVFGLGGISGTYMGKTIENPLNEKANTLVNYTYISISGGLGVQYRPSSLASFYAQTQYTVDLNQDGLGASKYQYDALGLTIGMKINPFTFKHRRGN